MAPKQRTPKVTRNPYLIRRIGKYSRFKMYHKRGIWAIKAKNGGAFPYHEKKHAADAPAVKPPKFYPADDVKKPLVNKHKPQQLSSGLLLVTAFEELNHPEFAEEELTAVYRLTLTPRRHLLATHPELEPITSAIEAKNSGKVGVAEGYKPLPKFSECAKEPLLDINMNDFTELWLISWPKDQNPYFSQEVSLKLGPDGELGSFVDPSGKEYDL
ncbi:hypothetical protein DVH24_042528 [Malus domestica]|uniref:Large ribosomal subunit protein uL6 N-terminal domain-containing protein n=1 Tax=Malus domestica TaxID=3750 RepID=A0A498JFD5_MALDO|nr:hypothetical protein DVH24_042528 [Malus domestica]